MIQNQLLHQQCNVALYSSAGESNLTQGRCKRGDQQAFCREPALRMPLAAVTKVHRGWSFTPLLTGCSDTCGPMSKVRDILRDFIGLTVVFRNWHLSETFLFKKEFQTLKKWERKIQRCANFLILSYRFFSEYYSRIGP